MPQHPRSKRLALIAHDEKKAALADWVAAHRAALAPHRLICTGTTGSDIPMALGPASAALLVAGGFLRR